MKAYLLVTTLVAWTPMLAAERLAAQQVDAAADAWSAGDHEKARQLYSQRLAVDSMDVQALHRLGLLLAWQREYARAIPLLERVVQMAPSVEARTDLANVLAWSGSYDRALAVLKDMPAHATSSGALHSRARFLSWARRYGEAEVAYRMLIDADPSDAEALRGLARVTTWRGDLREGERLWRSALEADADAADAHIGLSQVLRWRGRSREALEHAHAAVRLRPDDPDALEQLAWAESALAPAIAPTFSAETDSDDNRLYTAALSATVPVNRRVHATLKGYVRRADGPAPAGVDPTPESLSIMAGARAEVGDGWALFGAAGVTDRSAADPAPAYAAGLASPAWLRVNGSVAWSHSVLDATADLIGRDVKTDGLALSAGAELMRALRLDAGFTYTRFDGETSNDRVLGRVAVEARPTAWLRLRPRITAFRFENSVQEGYFAPDEYAMAEFGIGLERYLSGWSISAEVAPGAQRIGSDGQVKGALSARARAGYTIAPGREVGLGLSFSELGMERLTAGAGGYRHRAMVLSGSWGL